MIGLIVLRAPLIYHIRFCTTPVFAYGYVRSLNSLYFNDLERLWTVRFMRQVDLTRHGRGAHSRMSGVQLVMFECRCYATFRYTSQWC